jgi:predicted deacylase
MRTQGMLPGDPGPAPDYETVLNGDWQLAPIGGLLVNHVDVGDQVAAETLLATIHDPFGSVIAELIAPHAGFVMGTRHLCTIQPGEWATCVVRELSA